MPTFVGMTSYMKRAATPWLMLAPALAAAAILVLLPVLDTLWLSLHDVIL